MAASPFASFWLRYVARPLVPLVHRWNLQAWADLARPLARLGIAPLNHDELLEGSKLAFRALTRACYSADGMSPAALQNAMSPHAFNAVEQLATDLEQLEADATEDEDEDEDDEEAVAKRGDGAPRSLEFIEPVEAFMVYNPDGWVLHAESNKFSRRAPLDVGFVTFLRATVRRSWASPDDLRSVTAVMLMSTRVVPVEDTTGDDGGGEEGGEEQEGASQQLVLPEPDEDFVAQMCAHLTERSGVEHDADWFELGDWEVTSVMGFAVE